MVSMSEHMQPHDGWNEGQGRSQPGRSMPSSRRVAGARGYGQNARALGQDGRSLLEIAVRNEVIPRLIALPWAGCESVSAAAQAITPQMLKRLVVLCLEPESQGVAAYIMELYRSGASAALIYEGLLTPTARLLGEMWENDTCSLADVTIGVLRLQNAQRAIAARTLDERAPALGAPRALLLPVPGEQHTFGLSIVLDYFQRAGWEARLGPAGTRADALAMVRAERTELVGLSFACDELVPTAKALIAALRKASANPDIIIMVGGPPFVADPSLAAKLGADATATDGNQAVVRANELLHTPATAPSEARP